MKKKLIAFFILASAVVVYAAPPMIESGGNLFFPRITTTDNVNASTFGGPVVVNATASVQQLTVTSPGAANAIIATAGGFQNASGVGTSRQYLASGGASASTTWISAEASVTFECFTATAGVGSCESDTTPTFVGSFKPTTDGHSVGSANVTCSWGQAGSGAGNVAIGIYDCGTSNGVCGASPSTLCQCQLTTDCTLVNKPVACVCSGTFSAGHYYMMSLHSNTTCGTNNPAQIICNAAFME